MITVRRSSQRALSATGRPSGGSEGGSWCFQVDLKVFNGKTVTTGIATWEPKPPVTLNFRFFFEVEKFSVLKNLSFLKI